ncbi:MAG TPA: hypothetical protein VF980_05410 [Thermoanaerobaculia bacterium]
MKADLDKLLADLKRQRDDIEARIQDVETQSSATAELLDRVENWRRRAEKMRVAGPDDETIRIRR